MPVIVWLAKYNLRMLLITQTIAFPPVVTAFPFASITQIPYALPVAYTVLLVCILVRLKQFFNAPSPSVVIV